MNFLTASNYHSSLKRSHVQETEVSFYPSQETDKTPLVSSEVIESKKNQILHIFADQINIRGNVQRNARILRRMLGIENTTLSREDKLKLEFNQIDSFREKV